MSVDAWSRKTILIVEDDPQVRSGLADALLDEGYLVAQAANGEAGLEVARRLVPDAVLLDLSLPGRSGLEVLRDLKAVDATRRIPVVVASAYARMMGTADRALASGVVQKPCELDDLLAVLEDAIAPRPVAA